MLFWRKNGILQNISTDLFALLGTLIWTFFAEKQPLFILNRSIQINVLHSDNNSNLMGENTVCKTIYIQIKLLFQISIIDPLQRMSCRDGWNAFSLWRVRYWLALIWECAWSVWKTMYKKLCVDWIFSRIMMWLYLKVKCC